MVNWKEKAKILEAERLEDKRFDEERKISDEAYAPMIIKTIVFGMLALICVGFITALINMVMNNGK